MSLEEDIHTEDLGDGVAITYYETPDNKTTGIAIAPLGQREGLISKAKITVETGLGLQNPLDVNIVTFPYSSRNGWVERGFANDVNDLALAIEKTEDIGIDRNLIGGIAICYGANVLTRYLEDNPELGFSVFVAPYLGRSSVRPGLRWLETALKIMGKLHIPAPVPNLSFKFFDPGEYVEHCAEDFDFSQLSMPMLAIDNNLHDLMFDPGYLSQAMEGENRVYQEIRGKGLKAGIMIGYEMASEFLEEHHFPRLQG